MFDAKVTLLHVFDLYSHDASQLYVRSLSEVAEEQQNLARNKLDSFLTSEFPVGSAQEPCYGALQRHRSRSSPRRTGSNSSSCPHT